MSSPTESLLIVGTGALASLFAARFAAVDLPVTMLGNWHEGVRALREQGVHLVDTDETESTYPVQVINSPEDHQRFSHALLLVKSWQTERTAQQLVDCMEPDGRVLTLQNGLGNREVLVRFFGEGNVHTGVTTTGATLLGPGRVRAGGGGTISLIEDDNLRLFVDWFQRAGFSVQTVSDMGGLIWGKLVVNAAINPLTALLGVPNGELLHLRTARVLMSKTAREVAAVATAKGMQLPFEDPVTRVEEVARKTAINRSSMLQDIQRGAPTEIDAICGAIINNGTELGVPTPVNDTLYHLVKALVEKIS
jgi:2-dehydropantoate 2-reductase